ncbi:MAG TPA: hypothetical protein VFS18_03760 [Actinomycetota bacterium]|nr:hypothetical protein [Actinomycetota bacterium]
MDIVETLHRFVGYAIPTGFGILMLWALFCLLAKKEPLEAFWTLLGMLQAVIGIQLIVGIVLFISGARPASNGPSWLHYIYGAVFPALVLTIAHRRARRVEVAPWLVFGVAAFFCCFSTIRALQTGLGID